MSGTDWPDVRPGQVWEDNDPRSYGRKLNVQRVEGLYVYCRVVHTSRMTRIALKRMRPTSTGYRLLSDPNPQPQSAADWPAALKPEGEALETAAGDADYVAWAAACAALVEKVRRLMATAHAIGSDDAAVLGQDYEVADALLSGEQDQ